MNAREFLAQKKIAFTERDVIKQPLDEKEFAALGKRFSNVRELIKPRDQEELSKLKDSEVVPYLARHPNNVRRPLIDDLLTSARVTTTAASRLIKMPRDKFETLLGGDDKLAVKVFRSFCRTLSERLRNTSALLSKTQAMTGQMR